MLVWLGHHRNIKPPGLFALYVAGYSAFRILEESLRVDPSEHFLGLRLNMYVASVLTVVGIAWFAYSQRHGRPAAELPARRPGSEDEDGPGPGAGPAESAQAESRPAGPGAAGSRAAESSEAGPGAAGSRAAESSEAARATDTA